MYENIPEKEKEKIIKLVLIFCCLFMIVDIGYLTFFHYITCDTNRVLFGILFISPFIFFIYKLIKTWKSEN